MISRTSIIALGLTLSACNQSAPTTAEAETAAPDAASPGTTLPNAAELLAGPLLAGTWEAVGDEATIGARFTSPDNPDTLTIGCNTETSEAFVNWTVSNPAADGEVRIYAAGRTHIFAATGSNDGGHLLNIAAATTDPRIAALKVQQERFAVQGFGQAMVVPWDASIADALNGCAG